MSTRTSRNNMGTGNFSGRRKNRSGKKMNNTAGNVETPKPTSIDAPATDETKQEELDVENNTDQQDDEQGVCWICAESVKFYSLSECNHRTCHVCALRLRALYKKLECTFCKHLQTTVIFTSSPDRQFEDYKQDEMLYKDPKLSIIFESKEMMDEALILLRFNCPDSECVFVAKGWNDLKAHTQATHGKIICDLCIRFKKVFAHEHALYTTNQFNLHMPPLSPRPRKIKPQDKPGEKAHPLCEFCKQYFFGDDELFSHLRDKHEECFLCKQQGVRDQYFLDYNGLEKHFKDAHYPCIQQSCLDQKFVVFSSQMDLKAHMVEEHGASMSARDMKDARRVEANFDFGETHSMGQRRDRVRDRGRERDREPPPLQNRRSNGRSEALTLTQTALNGSGPEPVLALPQTNSRISPSHSRDNESAAIQRYSAVMARLAVLTNNSSAAETSVRYAIQSYLASESTARDIILTFYNIVDGELEATSSLIAPLVDLLDNEEKKRGLLQAFNGFKIEQRQQFPDLVLSGQESAYAAVARGIVLNAKHSTASRQSTGQVWDRVARAANSSSSISAAGPSRRPMQTAAPLLSVASRSTSSATPAMTVAPTPRLPQRSTPWISSSNKIDVSAFSRENAAESSNDAPKLSNQAFPALPTATARTKPAVGGNQSLRNIIGNSGSATNAWDAVPQENVASRQTDDNINEVATDNANQKKRGKKKGKEKVTLFTLGTFPA